MTTKAELEAKVLTATGLDKADFESLPQLDRFDFPGSRWSLGESPPGGEALLIMGLFDCGLSTAEGSMAGDIHVYVAPRSFTGDYYLYTFNRVSMMSMRARMPEATFADELAREYVGLAQFLDDRDADDEEDDEPTEVATPQAISAVG